MTGDVDLRLLRIFFVLAHELHFGRTAERLQVSQSRVSQAIRSLEVSMGAALFDRTSRRVALTPTGRHLLEVGEPAVQKLLDAIETVRRPVTRGVAGVLQFGLPNPSSGGPHLLEIVRSFRDVNPSCEVRFVPRSLQEDPVQQLRDGAVDLAALRLPLTQPDLEIGPVLSSEPRVLLVAETDPLAFRDSIEYDEVGDRPVSQSLSYPDETMDVFIPPVTSTGRVLNRIPNESVEQLMLRVALGEQVHPTVASWMTHHHRPGVVAVPIRDLPDSQTALVKIRTLRSPRVLAFLDAARTVLESPR